MIAPDAAAFASKAIHPETAGFNSQLAAMLAAAPSITTMEPSAPRALREAGQGTFGPIVLSDMAVDRDFLSQAV
ncbi:MAG: hypothetical protein KGJ86_01790 [Chloroflexota bacterium]|nr:hypothetical protein [Chloroflexota bacterium]